MEDDGWIARGYNRAFSEDDVQFFETRNSAEEYALTLVRKGWPNVWVYPFGGSPMFGDAVRSWIDGEET